METRNRWRVVFEKENAYISFFNVKKIFCTKGTKKNIIGHGLSREKIHLTKCCITKKTIRFIQKSNIYSVDFERKNAVLSKGAAFI